MTARGAADFLTRSTAVLGGLFVVMSIVLAAVAGSTRQPVQVDTSLVNESTPANSPAVQPVAPAPQVPAEDAPAVPLAQ